MISGTTRSMVRTLWTALNRGYAKRLDLPRCLPEIADIHESKDYLCTLGPS